MTDNRQRVDKATFKQIFYENWETFQQCYPCYQQRDVQAVITQLLGCGDLASGYITYLCEHCLEEKGVALSCKSSFCLSCFKVYIDHWVAHISQMLYEGVAYRHVVLTVPETLGLCFHRDRHLLGDLMQCGVAMLSDALAWVKKRPIEATAGR